MWYEGGDLVGVMSIHVDEFLYAGRQSWQKDVVRKVEDSFPVGKEEEGEMLYLGMHVKTYVDEHGGVNEITVDQADYIGNIQSIPVSDKQVAAKGQRCSADMHRQFR